MNDATAGSTTITTLVYAFDGRRPKDPHLLLIKRERDPNAGCYSPLGGKVDLATGESPAAGALRELHEETGQRLAFGHLRPLGLLAERHASGAHWWVFCFGVELAADPERWRIDEGSLVWMPVASVADQPIPATDRHYLWPLVRFWWERPELQLEPFSLRIDHEPGLTPARVLLEYPAVLPKNLRWPVGPGTPAR